jgi:hypothetical protein
MTTKSRSYDTDSYQEEVRRVLRDCIAYLVQLKEQVRKLMLFFTTVSRLLDNAMSSHVTPFMELVASAEDQRTNGHFVRRQVMQVGIYALIDGFWLTWTAHHGIYTQRGGQLFPISGNFGYVQRGQRPAY